MDTQRKILKSWKAEWKATVKALGYGSSHTQLIPSWRDDAIAGGGTVQRRARKKLFGTLVDGKPSLEVITGRKPSRYGLLLPAGGWATTFSASTDILWPDDIQEAVNLDNDWEPNRLALDEFVTLMDRVAARFGISEDGLMPGTSEVLARLSEVCPADVVVRPDDLWGGRTVLHLWCVATAPGPKGPYMATRDKMQPILRTLIDGAKEFRLAYSGLS